MRFSIVILLFVIFPVLLQSQATTSADTLPEAMSADTLQFLKSPDAASLPLTRADKKVSVRMEMGSTFGLGSGSEGLFGVYAAPHISYEVSPRLRVNFGAKIQNSNFINYYNPYYNHYPEYTRTFDSNITTTQIYAEGAYLLNPRLVVNARVYKTVSAFGEPQLNPRLRDLDGDGASVGFNYKVTDNFQVGAQVGYSRGRQPYDPFYHNYNSHFTPDPFFSNPYHPFD
jgi:hypothetical protein